MQIPLKAHYVFHTHPTVDQWMNKPVFLQCRNSLRLIYFNNLNLKSRAGSQAQSWKSGITVY